MNKSIEKRNKNDGKDVEIIYRYRFPSVSDAQKLESKPSSIALIITIIFMILRSVLFLLTLIIGIIMFCNEYAGSDSDTVIIKNGLMYFNNEYSYDSRGVVTRRSNTYTVYKVEKVIETKRRIKIYGNIEKYDDIKGYSFKVKKISILNTLEKGEEFVRDARALIGKEVLGSV